MLTFMYFRFYFGQEVYIIGTILCNLQMAKVCKGDSTRCFFCKLKCRNVIRHVLLTY